MNDYRKEKKATNELIKQVNKEFVSIEMKTSRF